MSDQTLNAIVAALRERGEGMSAAATATATGVARC